MRDEWMALGEAGRALVAAGGLRKLSLRSVAAASGWTRGELRYRVGKRERLIEIVAAGQTAAQEEAEAAWIDRFAALPRFDGWSLAAAVAAYLDDQALHRRETTLFWEELLLEAGVDPALQPVVGAWIDARQDFWMRLLAGRHPKADILARLIARFVTDEQLYTVVLGAEPGYRLVRDAGLRRLCQGLEDDSPDRDGALFESLLAGLAPDNAPPPVLRGRASAVTRATATLMREQGVSVVTHRAVAAALGVSPSAVAHHFRTHLDLVRGGYEALYDTFLESLDTDVIRHQAAAPLSGPGALMDPDLAAVGLSRTTHMVVLAAARDSAFVPLVARLRRDRGRSSRRWIGELVPHPAGDDRCLAQIASLVLGGEVFLTLARGDAYSGRSPRALADLVALTR